MVCFYVVCSGSCISLKNEKLFGVYRKWLWNIFDDKL